jgi:hypothetical protein
MGPVWYLFPFGRANHLDPTRPVTTIKTAWKNAKVRAGVTGRLHDARHTITTELAEHGAGDQTIMDIAGHVSPRMLRHYSHIRMQAKRHALEGIATTDNSRLEETQECPPVPVAMNEVAGESLQKSLQAKNNEEKKEGKRKANLLKRIGSPGRIRTYNPSVNSRMLYH